MYFKILIFSLIFTINTITWATQIISVKTIKAQITDVYEIYEALGECKSVESKDFFVKTSGTIDEITSQQGTVIEKDSLILVINKKIAQALINSTLSSQTNSEINYNRNYQLYKKGMCSEQCLADSKQAYMNSIYNYEKNLEQYNNMVIKSPFNGYLGTIKYKIGDTVKEGDFLFSITNINNNKKEILIYLPEKLIKFVTNKTKANIEGIDTSLYIDSVSNNINKENGNFIAKILIDNKNQLIHGSIVKVSLILNPHKTLTLPERVILEDNSGKYVYQVNDNLAKKTYITSGIRFKDSIEITSDNLSQDSIIISEGLTKLYEGANIKIVN